MDRRIRATTRFHTAVRQLMAVAPALSPSADILTDALAQIPADAPDFAALVRPLYQPLNKVRLATGTLSDAVEWEIVKLQARVRSVRTTDWPPLFRDRHVHIGTLIDLWRHVARETEQELADQGTDTFFDIGPWGGFNFVVNDDGYTRMKFARLTLGVGSLTTTPVHDHGGPFFDVFMPRYKERLAQQGLMVPEEWQYRNPKHDPSGKLLELSCTYYFPHHTYDNRTFVKVRLSREFETYEEIMVWDFLELLTRLYHTNDWATYKQETKDVDVRFDLQDFVSLSHIMEDVYHRTDAEERLLQEIKDAFRGPIRERPVLYNYLDQLVKSKWIENLVWGIGEKVLSIRKFERPFSLTRDILTRPLPPQLLIPVKRHVQAYHDRIGSYRPVTLHDAEARTDV